MPLLEKKQPCRKKNFDKKDRNSSFLAFLCFDTVERPHKDPEHEKLKYNFNYLFIFLMDIFVLFYFNHFNF